MEAENGFSIVEIAVNGHTHLKIIFRRLRRVNRAYAEYERKLIGIIEVELGGEKNLFARTGAVKA